MIPPIRINKRNNQIFQMVFFEYILLSNAIKNFPFIYFIYTVGNSPKIKKEVHSLEDHGPHSVDTDFTYVVFKTP